MYTHHHGLLSVVTGFMDPSMRLAANESAVQIREWHAASRGNLNTNAYLVSLCSKVPCLNIFLCTIRDTHC